MHVIAETGKKTKSGLKHTAESSTLNIKIDIEEKHIAVMKNIFYSQAVLRQTMGNRVEVFLGYNE